MDYLADAMDEDCYSPYDFKLLLEEEPPAELVQLCIRAQRRGHDLPLQTPIHSRSPEGGYRFKRPVLRAR
jgi:hypothetical protein